MNLYATRLGHFGYASDRFQSAEEHASGASVGLAGDVQTVVISINEVDVRIARRAKQNGVAGGFTSGGVRGGIFFSEVSLDFDDPPDKPGKALADQYFTQKCARDRPRITIEKGPVERADRSGLRLHLRHAHEAKS
jgi:hypothetical protein